MEYKKDKETGLRKNYIKNRDPGYDFTKEEDLIGMTKTVQRRMKENTKGRGNLDTHSGIFLEFQKGSETEVIILPGK